MDDLCGQQQLNNAYYCRDTVKIGLNYQREALIFCFHKVSFTKHICICKSFRLCSFSFFRNARKKMKPDSFLDSDEINIQFEKSSKNQIIIPDEQANGVYGLVITGHSLVRKV